jgi:hypothetical protein
MKVIGAGLPRTATTTQMLALEMLGVGPCYHMRDLLADLEGQLGYWESALDGNPDWDAVFDGYASVTDWPGAYHWRELMDVYPDAKVLLSVRDGLSWERSMRDTIWPMYHADTLLHHMSRARYHVDPLWRRWVDLMIGMTWTHEAPFAGSYSDSHEMIDAMERWNDEVMRTVPADRLLVWHPEDGWEPLCAFLEVPVPDEPLPNVNDTRMFRDGIVAGALQAIQAWHDAETAPKPAA